MTTTSYLPGFEPPVTKDFWTPTPDGVVRRKGLLGARARVWLHLIKRSAAGQSLRLRNQDIADALDLPLSTVNRCLIALKTEHPPGVDHPYIAIAGATSRREIVVLYRGKDAPSDASPAMFKSARRSTQPMIKSARSCEPQTPEFSGFAASAPLCNTNTQGNENEGSLSFPPPEASRTPTPVHASQEPAGPPTTASVLARFQALADRLAAEEAAAPPPALTPEVAAAREMASAQPAPPPAPTISGAYSQGTPQDAPRGKSAATPRLKGLVHALYRSGGEGAAVGELVRHVAWLFDATKPETVRCWTQGFGEAVGLLEPAELIAIIEASGRSRIEPHRRSRYLSVALTDRLVKAKREQSARARRE